MACLRKNAYTASGSIALLHRSRNGYDTDVETGKNNRSKMYIPALSYEWLTPYFDPLLKWVMRDGVFKIRLLELAHLEKASSVLDLGCGTGTLTILAKKSRPSIQITGLDIDPDILEIAREKAARAGVQVHWEIGMADDLIFDNASFDLVLSSLMFHHLDRAAKVRALEESFRVLKPGRELFILDFAMPHTTWMKFIAKAFRNLEEVEDNFKGLIPEWMRRVGFEGVTELDHFSTTLGPISIFRGQKSVFSLPDGK
jgi:SAM-dependent methyltransferase